MKKNKFIDKLATTLLTLAGLTILGILISFIFYILKRGLPVLTPSFIFGPPSEMEAGGGVGPELFNTFYILVLSLAFSLPVGLGAGIWLAEYAKPGRVVNIIRTSTEMLATVPSIVFGLFGMIIFVNFLGLGFTIIGGALTLSLLNLPVLIRVTEEAVRAVPKSYRMASLALGATKSQTLFRVVLPAALPRIITGVTLVAGRAIGESAILIFTAGTTVSRFMFDLNPFASGETLAVHLWYVNSEGLIPDATRIADGSAALLLILVLIFNLLLVIPTKRYEKKVKLN
ncbi:phosphate ABC transporter permease PstA [Carboxydothermus hydrogenoformans]|uniref:Phosphate transport system permease protein PstA n=1 Tax=Carboxydothermus hydrogenoformans (strain ATCC BAA-161 / DSM 6008 / Z-2901) TaxID=246194 RepID=Q3ADZ7_CARHZ|nr:phosphate ABC transporter permease PstA [Carboxydothermus hydrogenoformans]ABB16020.1 phosphate ABC transporter, permease protein [Carboxydothermus hydrogenoformans Z-2901]